MVSGTIFVLKPRILKEFFERYRRAKFPNDTVASNALKSLGLPSKRIEAALEIVKANGRYAGVIRETPSGPFVSLDSPGVPAPTATPQTPDQDDHEQEISGLGVPSSGTQDSPAPASPKIASEMRDVARSV